MYTRPRRLPSIHVFTYIYNAFTIHAAPLRSPYNGAFARDILHAGINTRCIKYTPRERLERGHASAFLLGSNFLDPARSFTVSPARPSSFNRLVISLFKIDRSSKCVTPVFIIKKSSYISSTFHTNYFSLNFLVLRHFHYFCCNVIRYYLQLWACWLTWHTNCYNTSVGRMYNNTFHRTIRAHAQRGSFVLSHRQINLFFSLSLSILFLYFVSHVLS